MSGSQFYNVRIQGDSKITSKDDPSGKGDKPFEFRTTRANNILGKQSDYEVGVCRFKIPTQNIPSFFISEDICDNHPLYLMYNVYGTDGARQSVLGDVGSEISTTYSSQPVYLNGNGLAYRMGGFYPYEDGGGNVLKVEGGQDTPVASPDFNNEVNKPKLPVKEQREYYNERQIYNRGIYVKSLDDWLRYLNCASLQARIGYEIHFARNNSFYISGVGSTAPAIGTAGLEDDANAIRIRNALNADFGARIGRGGASWKNRLMTQFNNKPHRFVLDGTSNTGTSNLRNPAVNSGFDFFVEMAYPVASATKNNLLTYGFMVSLSNIKMSGGGSTRDLVLNLYSPVDGTGARQNWRLMNGFGEEGQTELNNVLNISNMLPMKCLNGNVVRKDGRKLIPSEKISQDIGDNNTNVPKYSRIDQTYYDKYGVDINTYPYEDDFSAFYNGIKTNNVNDPDTEANFGEGWLLVLTNQGEGLLDSKYYLTLTLYNVIQDDIAGGTFTTTTSGVAGDYNTRIFKSPYASYPTPTFSYDVDNQLVVYNIDKSYYQGEYLDSATNTNLPEAFRANIPDTPKLRNNKNFELFLNYGLSSYFNFEDKIVGKNYVSNPTTWSLSNPSPPFYDYNTYNTNQGKLDPSKLPQKVFLPPNYVERGNLNIDPTNNQGKVIIIDTSTQADIGNSVFSSSETSTSEYLRRNLHSFIVASNILSVKGELLSAGTESRKVLTDFEINPDEYPTYIQYYSQGYMRYYPLESNLPLRDMGLKVYYDNIQGDIYPLTIPNNMVGTIKLEFRPKATEIQSQQN